MQVRIGLDIGNYDTKTKLTKTPSSFVKRDSKDMMADETIYYKGSYYHPSLERNNQQTDKTENDYCLIMSLFGIAKELIERNKLRYPKCKHEEYQAEINKVDEILLGVGVPVAKFSAYEEKTINYYMSAWADGCEFDYSSKSSGDYHFKFKLKKCKVLPQDILPIACNSKNELTRKYEDYYVIGIGGGTIDVIPVSKGNTDTNFNTFNKGTTILYRQIIRRIMQETGKAMDYSTVEAVLLGKETIIDAQRKNIILEEKEIFCRKMVDELIANGYLVSDRPCFFIGGGALLLKSELEKNKNFTLTEFINDVHANAFFYEALIDS